MARSLFVFSLPILLSLSLLADAARNNLLPYRKQENNEDDSVILRDVFEQNSLLRLPSESENEMVQVPELVRTPWKRTRAPRENHNRLISSPPGLREGESDSIFRPRKGEEDSISPLRKGESDSVLLGRRGDGRGINGSRFGHNQHGRNGSRFGHHHGGEMKFGHYVFNSSEDAASFTVNSPRAFFNFSERNSSRFGHNQHGRNVSRFGHHQQHHGGEMKFGHYVFNSSQDAASFTVNSPRAFFNSSEDAASFTVSSPPASVPLDEKEFSPRAEKEEHKHGKHQKPCKSEGSGFEPRQRAFKRTGRGESEGSGFEPRERAFKRTRRGFPEREHALSERSGKGFPEREHTQFEHIGKGFQEREHVQFERIGRRGFPEREHVQFERIDRGFPEREHTQFEQTGKGFPEREHTHNHGQWEREFWNGEGQKDVRHERQEDPAAPWTDWLRSLLPRH